MLGHGVRLLSAAMSGSGSEAAAVACSTTVPANYAEHEGLKIVH